MTKIEALRKTVEALNNGADYDWNHIGKCNCGLVVQSCSHIYDADALRAKLRLEVCTGSWTYMLRYNTCCPVSGLPISNIFSQLNKLGFTAKDLYSLETLKDEKVLSRIGINYSGLDYFRKRDNLLAYLTAWIEILEEQEVKPVEQPAPVEKVRRVYVTVDKAVREVEIINN